MGKQILLLPDRCGQLSSGNRAQNWSRRSWKGDDVVPELRELILSRASGNPLYMEELTHSLLENGSVRKEGDQLYPGTDGIRDSGPGHHPGNHRGSYGPAGRESQEDHAGGLGDR